MSEPLSATPAALAAIRQLSVENGPLMFFQSGGCCDGSLPICLRAGELPPGPQDVMLGMLGDACFYVDGEQYRRWGRPSLQLDISPGRAEGFSLSPPDMHFVTRTPAGAGDDAGAALLDRCSREPG